MTSAEKSKTSLRRRTVLATAIAVIGLAGAANAYADPDPVDLKVVDRDTGQALQIWRHHGRLFIAGEPGARYSLRVTNHTDGRVLVVMSVDGVNIVTGETASYDQRGYVLGAYDSYDVNGWRKSNDEVAAFAFAPLPQSYAARTGRPSDVGVIGMAVFTERAPVEAEVQAPHPLPPIRPQWRDEPYRGAFGAADSATSRVAAPPPTGGRAASPAPFAAPAPPVNVAAARKAAPSTAATASPLISAFIAERRDEKLGTAHGAREWSAVNMTTFERATAYPQSIRRIEYDTYANLVASGVIRPYPSPEHRPQPFPSNPDGAGYVPDPPPEP
jgi:hypothetical protein